MSDDLLELPDRGGLKVHILQALSRYWPKNPESISALPIIASTQREIILPLKLQSIELPKWAEQWGINKQILVPIEACFEQREEKKDWLEVDWWLAAFLMLECWHERLWEQQRGESIHSYSFKLKGWDTRVWQAAWVNRIALFLREWAAQDAGKRVHDCFGALPKAEIMLTHDVDAIKKTLPIRLKQSVFNLYNSMRCLQKGEFANALDKVNVAFQFFFGVEDWWTFERLLAMEKKAGIKAQFNFYADRRKKTLKSWLFDPGYKINQKKMQKLFEKIKAQGGSIGLHPTFDAWDDAKKIKKQKEWLAQVAAVKVSTCRQHWLRFGWFKTWAAQEKAGIEEDTTLMFNDRSGFRGASALRWKPWNAVAFGQHELKALPTVLMDSHLYDYGSMSKQEVKKAIIMWIEECQLIGGQMALLWHPHTLTKNYGWLDGFESLITCLKGEK